MGVGPLPQEKFPTSLKRKVKSNRDSPFERVKRINDNSYIIDLASEYNVIFSIVSDHSPYVVGEPLNLRKNPFQEEEGDTSKDYLSKPFTRSQAKELQDLQAMFVRKEALEEFEGCQRKTCNVWKVNQSEDDKDKRSFEQVVTS